MLYGYRQFHSIQKTNNICKEIGEDVEARFGSLNFQLNRLLLKGEKTRYSYLIDDGSGNKKNKI